MLTQEQRAVYERDGYLLFDPEIAPAILDGVLSDLKGTYVGPPRVVDGVLYQGDRTQDAWKVSANVKALACAPKVLALLEQLYGRKPLPFQTLNFAKGTEQAAHSDTVHFNSSPETYMCGVWIALEDMDMDVGPLMYFPGSHKLPEVTLDDLGLGVQLKTSFYYECLVRALHRLGMARNVFTPGEEIYKSIYFPYYEPFIADVIARNRISPRYATIRKGQAFIWASNLLHGGSPQKDKNRTRHSQVTHYYFEGCRYYTPLLQKRTAAFRKITTWRNPEWII